MQIRTFSMTRSSTALPMVILAFVVLALLAGATTFAYLTLGTRRIDVDAEAVRVTGPLYSTTVPRSSIITSGVRVVDLDRISELGLDSKENGLGLPGLKEGWFMLDNGTKAFVMLTDRSKVLVVPTTEGYWLLLSAGDADELAATLAAKPT